MNKLPYVSSYKELLVYRKARAFSYDIFEASKAFPRDEKYSLTDQIRRSSRSIGAQIAEAWAKRRYEKHFISKLTDADGEQQETQHWIEIAADCGYFSSEQASDLLRQCKEIGRLLGGMIAKLSLFCGKPNQTIREPLADYFVDQRATDY